MSTGQSLDIISSCYLDRFLFTPLKRPSTWTRTKARSALRRCSTSSSGWSKRCVPPTSASRRCPNDACRTCWSSGCESAARARCSRCWTCTHASRRPAARCIFSTATTTTAAAWSSTAPRCPSPPSSRSPSKRVPATLSLPRPANASGPWTLPSSCSSLSESRSSEPFQTTRSSGIQIFVDYILQPIRF